MPKNMQKNIYRTCGIFAAITIIFLPYSLEFKTTDAATAPPFAEPSRYYILPHQSLWVSGIRYVPGEQIVVRQANVVDPVALFVAGPSGTFEGNITASNPYLLASTTVHYTVTGSQSRYPVKFAVIYGTYYPQIEPSKYYATPGSFLGVSGRGFAPNEPVAVIQNNYFSDIMYADKSGTIQGVIRLPSYGKITDLVARGFWSDKVSLRTITLSPQ
jgi:hypothetical protein